MYWFTLWDRFQNRLLGEWKAIPEEEAKQSRYYGFWGWLLVIYILNALGFISDLLDIIAPEIDGETGPTAFQKELKYYVGDAYLTRGMRLFQNALLLPFLVLAPIKHRLMPKAVIWSMWIGVIFYAAIIDAPGNFDAVIFNVAMAAAYTTLLTWYFMRSKRVNVTYLHRVTLIQSEFQQRLEQYRSGRAFTAFTSVDVKIPSPTKYYSAPERLWLWIAAIALILPLISIFESLIIMGLGIDETLGQRYAKDFLNPISLIVYVPGHIFLNSPFLVLAIITRNKLIIKRPDVNATQSAIIGSAIALLIIFLPIYLLIPSLLFSNESGAAESVGIIFVGVWALSVPMGFFGWFVGRLIWHLREKRSRKS